MESLKKFILFTSTETLICIEADMYYTIAILAAILEAILKFS